MKNIEVKVLDAHNDPAGMMKFLARLTQRGHAIKSMSDLEGLFESSAEPSGKFVETMMALSNHGTIKRFTPITIAIVGASRRFLAQARTNQVGMNYVSASLQYSDYGSDADFVVPYALTELDSKFGNTRAVNNYLGTCKDAMDTYKAIAEIADNDTAGYVAPQGLRNILIMQGNYESWLHFIRLRTCNRNTNETQYVALRIWEELLKTPNGEEFFKFAGPDCMFGPCREGKMCCGKPMRHYVDFARTVAGPSVPRIIIDEQWPLLKEADK